MTDPFREQAKAFSDMADALLGMKVTFNVKQDPDGKFRMTSKPSRKVLDELSYEQLQLIQAYRQRVVVTVRNVRYLSQLRRQRFGVRVVHHVQPDVRSIQCSVFTDPAVPLGQVWEEWFPSSE
jgi:hypothetical protein